MHYLGVFRLFLSKIPN